MEKMFTNHSLTENKAGAVINVKPMQTAPYLSRDNIYQKIHQLQDAAFDADRQTSP